MISIRPGKLDFLLDCAGTIKSGRVMALVSQASSKVLIPVQ